MNFSFMLTIILIILIFIKLNITKIPNSAFFIFLLIMLLIGEIYHYKEYNEKFTPYRYGSNNKYLKNDLLIHIPENHIDRKGLECSLEKNVKIKNIQQKRFDIYNDIKNDMNNVVYGSKQIDTIHMPNNFGDITKDLEQIDKINAIKCPPVCNLIDNESDCVEAIELREVLPNTNELYSTKPIFNDPYMMEETYKCLSLDKDSCINADGCKVINKDSNDICVYDKKKCVYHDNKCKKKCEYFNKKNKCPKEYCSWNSETLICDSK